MKKIVCEMCGGEDFAKQDGLFICQSCGMKYSAEEAKKMMVEDAAEAPATVAVKNTTQLENLLVLAQSSFNSKNYAQAEEFCNQVIAIDAANYTAWKLKGEAINFQITATNDRITEVYNCIMTSYRVLDDEGKNAHRAEILASLRVCLEGEIDFVLQLFKSNRPTDSMLTKVKNTFIQCAANVITSYTELGYSEAEADEYRIYIKNYFIKQVNATCDKTWDDVVYYNYYRGGFNDSYHPDAAIMKTYINEGGNLIGLLTFAEQYFTAKTPDADKLKNYQLQNYFHRELSDARSYKRMVSTTTNGYGAVLERKEYWQLDLTPTQSALALRQKEITRTCELADKLEAEMATKDPATRQKLLREWTRELNSIDLSYSISGGAIFGIIASVLAGIFFLCVASGWGDYAWFGYLLGVCLTFIGICIFGGANQVARATQRANQARADRLSKKIREIS
ncbi:MAG: hypothetical protein IJO72_05425 [Oscillospiraceae bacterium]|nr:hypothetical protein [Oscillospiraceae bacterium]